MQLKSTYKRNFEQKLIWSRNKRKTRTSEWLEMFCSSILSVRSLHRFERHCVAQKANQGETTQKRKHKQKHISRQHIEEGE